MRTKLVLAILMCAFVILSCDNDKDCISGVGGYETVTYTVGEFDKISVATVTEVDIRIGEPSLKIEGQRNILNVLNVEEKGGWLTIGRDNCFRNIKPLKITISTPGLSMIESSGVSTIIVQDTLVSSDISLDFSGVSSVDLVVKTTNLSSSASGECNAKISGSTTSHSISTSGESDIKCFDLMSSITEINSSGYVNAEVSVENQLKVRISGSGNVYYKGYPSIDQEISGSGKVIGMN